MAPKKEIKILVIDDEVGYRQLYKFLLEPMGYLVDGAVDGDAGFRLAIEKNYDVIFLDVHMSKMSGPEVLKRIKEKRPEQVVVIFSSKSDPTHQFEDEVKKLGAMDCLYKPTDINDVLTILSKVTGAHHG